MRNFLAVALLVSSFSIFPARAQNAASTGYEAQKAKLNPLRIDALAPLRALGSRADGKIIELRGQVKGSFTRDGQRALLIQFTEGESIVIDTPEGFRTVAATQPGANARFLCQVKNVPGADIALTLLNASDAPDPAQLFKVDDFETVVAPPNGHTLPSPEQIVIGGEVFVAPIKVVAGGKVVPKSAPKARNGNSLPSRSLPRSAQTSRALSPYFGFDESQRTAYTNLARRHNPRLGAEMASYIASAILTAAQTHRLDPRFLAAIVTVESSFDPYCLSSSGAMGLGQLMPFNLRPLGVSNAWDPMQNLNGSAKLLRQNLDIYGRQPNGTLLAVAAYHAGVGAVNRAGKAVPQRASTQRYVWKVYYAYRALAPELFPK